MNIGLKVIFQPASSFVIFWIIETVSLGAFASRAFAGDTGFELMFPIIMLANMLIPYLYWNKYEQYEYSTYDQK